jgi:hypothetical protein
MRLARGARKKISDADEEREVLLDLQLLHLSLMLRDPTFEAEQGTRA